MKPINESIALSNRLAHQPRKRFGQNFLHDQTVIQRIVDSINPGPDDHLVEIGPGRGALTQPLACHGARLDCIELDHDLAGYLEDSFAGNPRVNIHQQDILKLPEKEELAIKKRKKLI